MKYIVMSMQKTENKKLNGERICKIKWWLEKTEWKRFMVITVEIKILLFWQNECYYYAATNNPNSRLGSYLLRKSFYQKYLMKTCLSLAMREAAANYIKWGICTVPFHFYTICKMKYPNDINMSIMKL